MSIVNVNRQTYITINLDEEKLSSVSVTFISDGKLYKIDAKVLQIFAEYVERYHTSTGKALDAVANHPSV